MNEWEIASTFYDKRHTSLDNFGRQKPAEYQLSQLMPVKDSKEAPWRK